MACFPLFDLFVGGGVESSLFSVGAVYWVKNTVRFLSPIFTFANGVVVFLNQMSGVVVFPAPPPPCRVTAAFFVRKLLTTQVVIFCFFFFLFGLEFPFAPPAGQAHSKDFFLTV